MVKFGEVGSVVRVCVGFAGTIWQAPLAMSEAAAAMGFSEMRVVQNCTVTLG